MHQKHTNILFLSRLYSPHIGGVEKHVERISDRLLKKGFTVTIVTEQFSSKLSKKENYRGVKIYRIPIPGNIYLKKFAVWYFFLKNLKLILNADIIHCHDVFYWVFPFRFLIPFKKIYSTFHGYENYPLTKKQLLVHKIAEKLSNGNICVGHAVAKWYKTKPTYIIYGGVDAPKIRDDGAQNSTVFFGRLDLQTGIDQYLEIYRIVKESIPDFKLTIYGEGELKKTIPKSIKVYPFTINIEKIIANNKFIFVSRYLSMLEALVQKRIVIAVYDNPIKKDYLLLSPFKKYVIFGNNPIDVSEKLIRIIKNPKQETEMINNGYAWAKEQSWEKVAGIYERLWKI